MTEGLTEEIVTAYLQNHPGYLDRYILENVPVETVQQWIFRGKPYEEKRSNIFQRSHSSVSSTSKMSLSKWKSWHHSDKQEKLENLMTSLMKRPNSSNILSELACCISSAISADGYCLYLPNNDGELILDFASDSSSENSDPFDESSSKMYFTCVADVAKSKEILRIHAADTLDKRSPEAGSCFPAGGRHILAAPILQSNGKLTAVLELYRRENDLQSNGIRSGPFLEEDEEIVGSFLVWGGIALHYSKMYQTLTKQRSLQDFLLTVVNSIFQDMISMDTIIIKIMNFAQKLVNADRASLFLVDHKAKELHARIFDMGNGVTEKLAQEIRFPITTGIAGEVASTGKVLNITDAYSDSRFNRSVDQRTGYQTKTILCMPIFIEGQVIGVVQMINKRDGIFTEDDEESFKVFAGYCGLALHHAKLYERIRKSEQKYRVALEVLSYHNRCSEEEVVKVLEMAPTNPIGIERFDFDVYSIDDFEKVRSVVFMFTDLFGLNRVRQDVLVRFILTVRKNYRRVPYHNWTHGFAVANCMYVILKKSGDVFQKLDSLALFVASLCHDLDHRGKNNKFMLESASPLAAIYTTSTMEHHHFNQTVTILQQEGHNFLSRFSSEEYKQILGIIKHCILATDLAVFFPNRAKLAHLVGGGMFSLNDRDHKLLLEAIAMTASDLCASTKPWDIQAKTVGVIFEEFYQQGDAEKAQGIIPIPMMDREQIHLQPESQVGFISSICIPCYELLNELIPATQPLLDGCHSNLNEWERRAEKVKNQENNPCHSNPMLSVNLNRSLTNTEVNHQEVISTSST